MGRIHVLSEQVINQIAAGEVVERPASVVKELLENALDAGSTRIRVAVEAGGKKLIQIVDNGCGMNRDDAMLAFERHATSKMKNAGDLLSIATLGFRGEALPSIASVSRLRMETRAAEDNSGTVLEIAGGKILKVEEAGLPLGTSFTIRDLFFNTPARKKFLKAESTELSHIASLVTHYALAHPDKHWELHSASNAMLVAAPVATHGERLYQVFGKETLDQLLPVAAMMPLAHVGLPQPPPWSKPREKETPEPAAPGEVRIHGFVSKPEVQKLNRNSIFIFVNGRLIRDRLVQHAITEAYRNIMPPTVFPVILLFLEMPYAEVDVNVHPSKTEVRFRQQSLVHDFVRDSIRAVLMAARPAPQFVRAINSEPTAGQALSPQLSHQSVVPAAEGHADAAAVSGEFSVFALIPEAPLQISGSLQFSGEAISVEANAALPVARFGPQTFGSHLDPIVGAQIVVTERADSCGPREIEPDCTDEAMDLTALASLRPVGQVRDSFILAVNGQGLWIIDQHACHERVLFEKILKQRQEMKVDSQRLLMPIVVELTPGQQAVFAEICEELQRNGFEVEPFGSRTIAVKTAPAGVEASLIEHLLQQILEQFEIEDQVLNLEKIRARIAASIACHAAIKINMPLEQNKMEWLLHELSKTQAPMSCPHGRPVVLRYSVKDIQKAFKRI